MASATQDSRRVYYDHEPAYRKIAAKGGRGWDDLSPEPAPDSYDALKRFLSSRFAPGPASAPVALDLGCGGGQAALLLAERGYVVHGIEYSETALELARVNVAACGNRIELHRGNCLNLSCFAGGQFDLAIDNHVLHCIVGASDRQQFLESVCRVLRTGAVLFSETMTCEGAFDPASVGADPETRIAMNHTRYWGTAEEITGEFERAGFEILFREIVDQREAGGCGDNLVLYARKSSVNGPSNTMRPS